MKDKKQFLQISLAAFIIPLLQQIFYGIYMRGIEYYNDRVDLYYSAFLAVGFIITPVLVFAVFYLIGRKPYLTFKLRSIMSALLIGNFASVFFGPVVYSAIVWERVFVNILDPIEMMQFFTTVFFTTNFLVALARLSIGHIRQKKLKSIPETQIS